MTYSCNTGGGACGSTSTTETVKLMHETFDGCDISMIDSLSGFDGWKMQNGYAVANSCNEGALTFDPIDGDAYSSVTIDLTVATSNICNFESTGSGADHVYVQYWDGSSWVTLDTYTRCGDKMVGDKTGQTFGSDCWSKLSYTIDEPNDDLQFRIVTDVTATDELVAVTEMCITATPKPEPVCEPVVTTFLYENFDAVCDPAQSHNVVRDDGWDVHYGSAYADGCNDGAMIFRPVDAGDQDSVTFSFDIAAGNLCNWESSGCDADSIQVWVTQNGCWQLLETFVRDGDVVRGLETGQTFNGYCWSTVEFTIDTPEDCMSFAVVSNLTAQDEHLWLDNVKITGAVAGDCDPVVELGSIGDKVWLDLDGDGVQDEGEAGVAGIAVALYKDGVATGLSTVTDANGEYVFTGLEAGSYAIQVSGVAEGYRLVAQNAGSDDLADSDVNAAGLSDSYALAAGENYRGLDAGIEEIPVGSLGDRVWFDANANGLQDEGEAGFAGVTVALWQDGVATGRTTVTDANGGYLFTGLVAGTYSIVVSGIGDGYAFAAQNAGAEAADSDVNAAGVSDAYTLAEGEDHFDLDAGVVAVAPTVADDAAKTCADDVKVIDVLANDDAGLTITAIDGQAIAAGETVTIASGAAITLNADGTLSYDGIAAWADVLVGMSAADAFTYTAVTVQGGEATADVDVDICGAGANSVSDFIPTLPETVQFTITDLTLSGTGWFSIEVTSDENPRLNVAGSTDVWCVDLAGTVETMTLDAHVYLADANDASLADTVLYYENLDIVNYILNHAEEYRAMGYADAYIQYSIWALTDEPTLVWDFEEVNEIVTDATANGEGFEAGSGDLVGLILAPIQEVDDDGVEITNYQNFIYGVAFDTLADCLCA